MGTTYIQIISKKIKIQWLSNEIIMNRFNDQMWKSDGWQLDQGCRINNSNISKFVKLVHIDRYNSQKDIIKEFHYQTASSQEHSKQPTIKSHLIDSEPHKHFWNTKRPAKKKLIFQHKNTHTFDDKLQKMDSLEERDLFLVRSYSPLKKYQKSRRLYTSQSLKNSQKTDKTSKQQQKQSKHKKSKSQKKPKLFLNLNEQIQMPLEINKLKKQSLRKQRTVKQLTFYGQKDPDNSLRKKLKSEKKMAQALNTLKIGHTNVRLLTHLNR